MVRRLVLAMVATAGMGAMFATPGMAADKETVCRTQGELMGVIQQARLDNVREANLTAAVAEARPDFSQKVLATVPNVGGFVYDMRKRDLRKVNLADVTRQQCLDNWDAIQALRVGE